MFERFTDKGIKAIMLAQEEARRLGHNFVGTEQILLGLIGEATGMAAKVLIARGVKLKEARIEVEKFIGCGSGNVDVEIPFTPRAKRILELSVAESERFNHDYVCTEHLLLGLIRDGEGVAIKVLNNLGIDLSELRNQVLIQLNQTPVSKPTQTVKDSQSRPEEQPNPINDYMELVSRLLENRPEILLERYQTLVDSQLVTFLEQQIDLLHRSGAKPEAEFLSNFRDLVQKKIEELNQKESAGEENEAREQAYLQLISELMQCTESQEIEQLLASHPDFVDQTLVDRIIAGAEHYQQKENEQVAQKLFLLAQQINQAIEPANQENFSTNNIDTADSETRQQAYLQLINALMQCSSEEELQQLLATHRSLLDEEFLQTLFALAQEYQQHGNEQAAQWLLSLAQVLSQSSGEHLHFLIKTFELIDQSKGDTKVVYPFWQQHLDKLTLPLISIVRQFAENNLAEVPLEQAPHIATVIAEFSNLIQQFPLGNRSINLELAITAYHFALEVLTRRDFPIKWALTQLNLGNAYCERIRGNKAQNLEDAIEVFNQALEVLTRRDFPIKWALTQNNLGIAYWKRIKEDKVQNLEYAIQACKKALEVYTRQDFPYEWARAKNNLGNAYCERIKEDKSHNLELAITAYKEALTVTTSQDFPVDWALTQMNLGNAYRERIKGDKAQNLEDAIEACNKALQVYTYKDFPWEWAQTHNNLGNAYRERVKGDKAQNLELAITAHKLALTVRNPQHFPLEWAQTKMNLGNAYKQRIKEDKTQNLELAITAYKQALEVFTRQNFPWQWAQIQNNLGNTYRERIKGDKAQNLELAITAYKQALEIFTCQDFPWQWAQIQNNLGTAYWDCLSLGKTENLKLAIASYKQTLEVRTPEADPTACFQTARNLGDLTFKQEDWETTIAAYELAINATEQLRHWGSTDDRRKEIVEGSFEIYANLIHAYVQVENFEKAIETADRSRARYLVDLMYVSDLQAKGEMSEEFRRRLQEYEEAVKERNRLQELLRSQGNPSTESGNRSLDIAQLRQQNQQLHVHEEITKCNRRLDEIFSEMSYYDSERAAQVRVTPLKINQMRAFLSSEKTALVEIFTTPQNTYILVLKHDRRVEVHTCDSDLQSWLVENWLYFIQSNFQTLTAATLLECDPSAIASVEVTKEKVNIGRHDGDTSFSFEEFQQAHQKELEQPQILQKISQRLKLDQLVENCLYDIEEIILVPHLYLHQIPFAALPLASGEYFGDRVLLRFAPSAQILDFCYKREGLKDNAMGTVENPTHDLLFASYEASQLAQMYQIPDDNRAIGDRATVERFYELARQVQTLHLSHHATANLGNPLQSALLLAGGEVTLQDLLLLRLPNLNQVYLSCCETQLSRAELTDDYLPLGAGFLVAGARNVISTLWAVDDMATALFTIFYHEFYQEEKQQATLGKKEIDRARILQKAQQKLRTISGQEFQEKCVPEMQAYLETIGRKLNKELRRWFKKQDQIQSTISNKSREEAQQVSSEIDRIEKQLNRVDKLRATLKNPDYVSEDSTPFSSPRYWSAFVCQGMAVER
jgi:CHAT domain-containing protein